MEIEFSLEEIDNVSLQVLNYLKNKVVIFNAPMGAGKTTLIKSLLKNLGVEDTTSSPTFSIVNVYKTKKNVLVYHFDLYRLTSEEEAYDFGIEEYLFSNEWCFIEWPEKTPNLLPSKRHEISLQVLPNGNRKLTIK